MAEEEIADSWEALEDSGELDKRLPQAKPANKRNHESYSVPMLQEDGSRTAFQPQFRILKRAPKSDTDAGDAQQKLSASKPIRTLEEREAAYAEARLRILGSATSPQENSNDSNANTTPCTIEDRPSVLSAELEQVRLTDNIVRLPKGPSSDGSSGFQSGGAVKR